MQIKIVQWRPNIISTIDEGLQLKLKVSKDMNMSEFKQLLECKYNIINAIVMRRTPLNQLKAVDVLTDSSDKLSKGLNELRVNEGIILYVEDKTEQEMTKWETEFELEVNRYQIKFNLLLETEQSKFHDQIYTQILVVDRRSTVLQLKEGIADFLGQNLEEIVFRRGGANGAELIDDDL